MRFTKSKDGKERCTLRLKFQFTREEIKIIKEMAKERCPYDKDWRNMLESWAALAIEGEVDEYAYPKGIGATDEKDTERSDK